MNAPTPEALLAELRMRGVSLSALGDRIRVEAPPRTVTAELRQALIEHKPALLALLDAEARGQMAGAGTGEVFHVTSGEMDFGDVCDGWKPSSWAAELRRKASRCDLYRPDIADYYRRWAADIERRLAKRSPEPREGSYPDGGSLRAE